jgi:hypothetical protein
LAGSLVLNTERKDKKKSQGAGYLWSRSVPLRAPQIGLHTQKELAAPVLADTIKPAHLRFWDHASVVAFHIALEGRDAGTVAVFRGEARCAFDVASKVGKVSENRIGNRGRSVVRLRIQREEVSAIGTNLWSENSGISLYSAADNKCTPVKSGIATDIVFFAGDGKALYCSQSSLGQTTIFRQLLRNGAPIGLPVPAVKMPFALREDYNGKDFVVSSDLSSIVFARFNGHQDLFLLSQR